MSASAKGSQCRIAAGGSGSPGCTNTTAWRRSSSAQNGSKVESPRYFFSIVAEENHLVGPLCVERILEFRMTPSTSGNGTVTKVAETIGRRWAMISVSSSQVVETAFALVYGVDTVENASVPPAIET